MATVGYRNAAEKRDMEFAYVENLKARQALNELYDAANARYYANRRFGITPAPEVIRSAEEEQRNAVKQRDIAFTNLKTVLKANDANEVLNMLQRQDDVVTFNRYFGVFKRKLSGLANLTPAFLLQIWERFKADLMRKTDIDYRVGKDLEKYQESIADMVDQLIALSRRKYAPLTDREKDRMPPDEVKAYAVARERDLETFDEIVREMEGRDDLEAMKKLYRDLALREGGLSKADMWDLVGRAREERSGVVLGDEPIYRGFEEEIPQQRGLPASMPEVEIEEKARLSDDEDEDEDEEEQKPMEFDEWPLSAEKLRDKAIALLALSPSELNAAVRLAFEDDGIKGNAFKFRGYEGAKREVHDVRSGKYFGTPRKVEYLLSRMYEGDLPISVHNMTREAKGEIERRKGRFTTNRAKHEALVEKRKRLEIELEKAREEDSARVLEELTSVLEEEKRARKALEEEEKRARKALEEEEKRARKALEEEENRRIAAALEEEENRRIAAKVEAVREEVSAMYEKATNASLAFTSQKKKKKGQSRGNLSEAQKAARDRLLAEKNAALEFLKRDPNDVMREMLAERGIEWNPEDAKEPAEKELLSDVELPDAMAKAIRERHAALAATMDRKFEDEDEKAALVMASIKAANKEIEDAMQEIRKTDPLANAEEIFRDFIPVHERVHEYLAHYAQMQERREQDRREQDRREREREEREEREERAKDEKEKKQFHAMIDDRINEVKQLYDEMIQILESKDDSSNDDVNESEKIEMLNEFLRAISAKMDETMELLRRKEPTITRGAVFGDLSDGITRTIDYLKSSGSGLGSCKKAKNKKKSKGAPQGKISLKLPQFKVTKLSEVSKGGSVAIMDTPLSDSTLRRTKSSAKNTQQIDERYQEFGKYFVYLPLLRQGIWDIRSHCGRTVQRLPKVSISAELVRIIDRCTRGDGHIDENDFNDLSGTEQELALHMMKESNFRHGIRGRGGEFAYGSAKARDRDIDRFNLLRGELIAGNDAPELLKELSCLVTKFIAEKTIPKTQGDDLLYQLALAQAKR